MLIAHYAPNSPEIATPGQELHNQTDPLLGINNEGRYFAIGLFPPPTLRECRHRGLARRLVAVRRPSVLMVAKGQRPHPRRTYGCRVHLHDTANDDAIGEHVEVVVIPLARWAARRSALEGQVQRPTQARRP